MNTRRSVTLAAIVVAAAVATPLVSASPAQATVSQDGCKLTALKPQFLNHCFRTHVRCLGGRKSSSACDSGLSEVSCVSGHVMILIW